MAFPIYEGKRAKEDRLEKLRQKKARLEQLPIVRQFIVFHALPWAEKQPFYQAWDEYYKAVLSSEAYLRYRSISEAFRTNKKAVIRELAMDARKALEDGVATITKPQVSNPYDLDNDINCLAYLSVCRSIDGLREEVGVTESEFKEIFQV